MHRLWFSDENERDFARALLNNDEIDTDFDGAGRILVKDDDFDNAYVILDREGIDFEDC